MPQGSGHKKSRRAGGQLSGHTEVDAASIAYMALVTKMDGNTDEPRPIYALIYSPKCQEMLSYTVMHKLMHFITLLNGTFKKCNIRP